jgi:hypothetical protein
MTTWGLRGPIPQFEVASPLVKSGSKTNPTIEILNPFPENIHTTGQVRADSGFVGGLTGDVVGGLTGDVVGDLTGDVIGTADIAKQVEIGIDNTSSTPRALVFASDISTTADPIPAFGGGDLMATATVTVTPSTGLVDFKGDVDIQGDTELNGMARFKDRINFGPNYDGSGYGHLQGVAPKGQTLISYICPGYVVASGIKASSQNFKIAAWHLGGNGVELGAGATSWSSSSDERLKDILRPLEGTLDTLDSIRCIYYRYKTDCMKDPNGDCLYTRDRIGFIAQDVQAHYPEIVHSDDNGELSLAYSEFIPVLCAAVKELSAQKRSLEDRLRRVETHLGLE